jgi:cytidylate kinase
VVVTISNQYGSGAVAVAHRVAELLSYELVDRQLPVVIEKGRSLGARLLESLERATPEVAAAGLVADHDERSMRAIDEAVRTHAARGNVVIVGRGSGAILGRRDDVLRVFMHAPREWRIAHVGEQLGVDEKTAASEVDRVDRLRRAFLRDWHGVEFGQNAELSIDTARFGVDGSAALIVAAVTARS